MMKWNRFFKFLITLCWLPIALALEFSSAIKGEAKELLKERPVGKWRKNDSSKK